MKLFIPFSFAVVLAVAGLAGISNAAEGSQDSYNAYSQKVAPLEQQLYTKQAELDAVYASPQPDTARAQQLHREVGELQGQLFAAETELRTQLGNSGMPYGGMHHPGEFSQGGYSYRGHRGGGYGRHGGRHHGGW